MYFIPVKALSYYLIAKHIGLCIFTGSLGWIVSGDLYCETDSVTNTVLLEGSHNQYRVKMKTSDKECLCFQPQ